MHMKLLDPVILSRGTASQRKAFETLSRLAIFEKLQPYSPVLAGTYPIDLDIEGSDLDIICASSNLEELSQLLQSTYGSESAFQIEHKVVHNRPTVIVRFRADEFPIEIFAQSQSVMAQDSVIHMLVEARLLAFAPPTAREYIRALKRSGMKTEPAFAECFEIKGDPYEELLKIARLTDREILQIAHRFHFRMN